jgi:hypothetical protein
VEREAIQGGGGSNTLRAMILDIGNDR